VLLGVCALLACLALGAPPARAGDTRPVVLPLTNGKSLKGIVEKADAREVVLRLGPEQIRRVPWEALTPLGYFRVKRALAPAADGPRRLQLAELAVDLGLYVEAREEYEKALALGAIRKEVFQKAVDSAERTAVRNGVKIAQRRAEAGDLEGALAIARQLKLHFATAPNAAEVAKLVAGLVKRVQALDAEAVKAKAELDKALLHNKRDKEILKRTVKARAFYRDAERRYPTWQKYVKIGNITRARKAAEAIDALLQKARINLGRLRRILPRDDPARQDVMAELTKVDKLQFDLRLGMAEFWKEATVYTRADEWAALASYIDPVNPELVELRDYLLTNRIRYRASDVTNAHGHVSGP
jgi:tetratricopeptide (TPR) repeat protein